MILVWLKKVMEVGERKERKGGKRGSGRREWREYIRGEG